MTPKIQEIIDLCMAAGVVGVVWDPRTEDVQFANPLPTTLTANSRVRDQGNLVMPETKERVESMLDICIGIGLKEELQ